MSAKQSSFPKIVYLLVDKVWFLVKKCHFMTTRNVDFSHRNVCMTALTFLSCLYV